MDDDITPMDRIGSVAESHEQLRQRDSQTEQDVLGASASPATVPLLRFLLTGQHESWFGRLYSSEAVCLGIFRLVPAICRQVIMSILWTSGHVRARDVKILLRLSPNANHAELDAKLQLLFSLSILNKSSHKGTMMIHLHSGFKTGLRNALTGTGASKAFGVTYEPREGDGSIDVQATELIEYGEQTWESMLKYMVSSRSVGSSSQVKPAQAVLDLLVEAGLMTASHGDVDDIDGLQITSQGFQFLLEERSVQIWQILMFYLQSAMAKSNASGDDGVDILQLYFTLNNMQLGRAYSAAGLSPSQKRILNSLEDYGLLYRRGTVTGTSQKHDQFYPTRLATTLCSAGSSGGIAGGGGQESEGGFLILETNYKIYAYTANELEIAILNLFIDIKVRYPNLIVGKLERETVKRAMDEGITAQQIISYLTTHAHPQMHKNNPLLPITVVDQLHLWDRERNRLHVQKGALIEFRQKHLFEDGVAYAKTLSCLLFESSKFVPGTGFRGRIFISDFAVQPIRDYLRTRKEQHEQEEIL